VHYLATRITIDLNLPENLGNFSRLDVFGDVVLWQREFWQGYDLKRDAYFSISVIPPGWENVPVQRIGLVIAESNYLYWSLEVNGQVYYFTAPVVPKEEAPQTVQPIPTPVGLPATAPPVVMPVAPPAAYP
jgi:hypothetical protein